MLLQADVARELQANKDTVAGWERNKRKPSIQFVTRIVRFREYNPFSPPQTVLERLSLARKLFGLSQEQASTQIGINETTLPRLNAGTRVFPSILAKVERFVTSALSDAADHEGPSEHGNSRDR